MRVWSSGICFALCGYAIATLVQEVWRGARIRQEGTGTDVFTAVVGLIGRNKRRYGGYIVHLGIVLIFFGFAGDGFKQEEQVLLKPGQQVTVGHYTVRHDSIQVTDDGQKQMITAHLTVFEDGTRSARCTRPSGSSGSARKNRRPKSPFGARSPKTSTSCCRPSI